MGAGDVFPGLFLRGNRVPEPLALFLRYEKVILEGGWALKWGIVGWATLVSKKSSAGVVLIQADHNRRPEPLKA